MGAFLADNRAASNFDFISRPRRTLSSEGVTLRTQRMVINLAWPWAVRFSEALERKVISGNIDS